MGIRQPLTVQQLEDHTGGAVAVPGTGRHIGQGKITAAQIQCPAIPFAQLHCQFPAVLHRVLTIRIGGNHTAAIRAVVLNPAIACLQCHTLAMVHIMVKYLTAGYAGQMVEDGLRCLRGTVIHHHHLPKSFFQQLAHIGRQAIIRFQRWD